MPAMKKEAIKRLFKQIALELGCEVESDGRDRAFNGKEKQQEQKQDTARSISSSAKIIRYYRSDEIKTASIKWSVADKDFSAKLLDYRKSAFRQADQGKKTPTAALLMLNHIVYFDTKMTILTELDLARFEQSIKKQLKFEYGLKECSDKTMMLCFRVVQKIQKDAKLLVLKEMYLAEEEG